MAPIIAITKFFEQDNYKSTIIKINKKDSESQVCLETRKKDKKEEENLLEIYLGDESCISILIKCRIMSNKLLKPGSNIKPDAFT